MSSTKNILSLLLKVTVTLGLIGFVIYQADLMSDEGRTKFLVTIRNVDLYFLFWSIVVSLAMNLLSSYKWHILLLSKKLNVGFMKLLGLYYVGKFFNLFLPTGMGGDIVRVYELGKITKTNSESLASVFLERFTGMVVLTVVSLLAVIVSIQNYDLPIITNSLLLCVVMTSIIVWLILDKRPIYIINNLFGSRFKLLERSFEKLIKLHDAIYEYKNDKKTLIIAFLISLVFYFLAVINVWVSAMAFSREIEFLTILVAVPAIMLIMNLPVSIGGLGLMEAAYSTIFQAFSYTSSVGLSTALLIRAKTIVDGILGGLFYLYRYKRPTTSISKPDNSNG
jgi:glycosyltransferase 2 family protein